MTETLAFHDRRVADTGQDPTGKRRAEKDSSGNWVAGSPTGDDTLDQTRIPQGSFFAELYCTNNPNNPIAPADLYAYNLIDGKWYLDLERMAPPDASNLSYPVWRMVIGKSGAGDSARTRCRAIPIPFPWKPNSMLGAERQQSLPGTPTGSNIAIDRIIWFTTQGPSSTGSATHRDWDKVYYNRGTAGTAALAGDHYAVVGPRITTNIGSMYAGSPYPSGTARALGQPSGEKIVLNPGTPGVDAFDLSGNDYTSIGLSARIQPPLGVIVAGSAQAAGWTDTTHLQNGIGISISEPLFSGSYYPEPTVTGTALGTTGTKEWYGDPSGTIFQPLDQPLDRASTAPLTTDGILPISLSSSSAPTIPDYKTVFLQRLANPLLPYDPVANPYRTVDWMPVDLTVFNGEDHQPVEWTTMVGNVPWDPDDPQLTTNPGSVVVKFMARQRGHYMAPPDLNLWSPTSDDPQQTQPVQPLTDFTSTRTLNFPFNLAHSLGFINQPFWQNPSGNATDAGQWLTSAWACRRNTMAIRRSRSRGWHGWGGRLPIRWNCCRCRRVIRRGCCVNSIWPSAVATRSILIIRPVAAAGALGQGCRT